MCSELTPRARIPDTRIPQLMQPWYEHILIETGCWWISQYYAFFSINHCQHILIGTGCWWLSQSYAFFSINHCQYILIGTGCSWCSPSQTSWPAWATPSRTPSFRWRLIEAHVTVPAIIRLHVIICKSFYHSAQDNAKQLGINSQQGSSIVGIIGELRYLPTKKHIR